MVRPSRWFFAAFAEWFCALASIRRRLTNVQAGDEVRAANSAASGEYYVAAADEKTHLSKTPLQSTGSLVECIFGRSRSARPASAQRTGPLDRARSFYPPPAPPVRREVLPRAVLSLLPKACSKEPILARTSRGSHLPKHVCRQQYPAPKTPGTIHPVRCGPPLSLSLSLSLCLARATVREYQLSTIVRIYGLPWHGVGGSKRRYTKKYVFRGVFFFFLVFYVALYASVSFV